MRHIKAIAVGSVVVIPIVLIVIFWLWILTVSPELFIGIPLILMLLYLCWSIGNSVIHDES